MYKGELTTYGTLVENEEVTAFEMGWIEVDGIVSRRNPDENYTGRMFTLKNDHSHWNSPAEIVFKDDPFDDEAWLKWSDTQKY